jgi:hypothetical protein
LEAPFATSARKRLSSSDVQMRDTRPNINAPTAEQCSADPDQDGGSLFKSRTAQVSWSYNDRVIGLFHPPGARPGAGAPGFENVPVLTKDEGAVFVHVGERSPGDRSHSPT